MPRLPGPSPRPQTAVVGALARDLAAIAITAGIALAVAGCERREPPAPDASPSVALPEVLAPTGGASAAGDPSLPAPPTPDSASLPQTHDVPHAEGPAFEARRDALWQAIVTDDPERAKPFFFPLGAYQQVKDVTNPAADWRHRLVAAYEHDIHALHARLGPHPTDAKFLGLDVPEARARWVEPGEEWNKIGYYRVFGTKLRYSIGDEPRTFDVKSLISWRGEWFVVHLSAIG